MDQDLLSIYKETQRESWGLFAPLELITTMTAAGLVKFSQLKASDKVLDVGCGTGVVAITAAKMGACVSALDLSPTLLECAHKNKMLAGVDIDLKEGDVESLPYSDETFDIVLSQFGHMFAPRAQLAANEMLRVLKPGGVIAFSTWPPDHFVGRLFHLVSQYTPPLIAVDPPSQWGDPAIIRNRLGEKVSNLVFDYGSMYFPALSLSHYRDSVERTLGPVAKLVQLSTHNKVELDKFRAELDFLASHYYQDNKIRQVFLMTKGIKE